ncbi:type VII secretion system-associated protein [Streptomyces sp. NPDC059629]|uniref:type VII secretion system-associated protein n=1 Tax=Streptomyces sp. NPDC059629 TaxID=3346889 RepID=UPI003684FDAA
MPDSGPTGAGSPEFGGPEDWSATDELVGLTAAQLLGLPYGLREAARENPGRWLVEIDPAYEGPEDIGAPDWAIVRQWWSGADGAIEGWRDNPAYLPSPRTLGWPEPRDAVDDAAQLAACGYRSQDEVVRLLAVAEVAVLRGTDGVPLTVLTEGGDPVVPVFTSGDYLAVVGPLGADVIQAADLAALLGPDERILLNPTGPVPTVIDTGMLRDAVAADAQAQDQMQDQVREWRDLLERVEEQTPAPAPALAADEAPDTAGISELTELIAPPRPVARTVSASDAGPAAPVEPVGADPAARSAASPARPGEPAGEDVESTERPTGSPGRDELSAPVEEFTESAEAAGQSAESAAPDGSTGTAETAEAGESAAESTGTGQAGQTATSTADLLFQTITGNG